MKFHRSTSATGCSAARRGKRRCQIGSARRRTIRFFFVNSPSFAFADFELRALTEEELFSLLQRALKDESAAWLHEISPDETHCAISQKFRRRRAQALNALEIAALTTAPEKNGVVKSRSKSHEQSIQKKPSFMTATGDAHYRHDSASSIHARQRSRRRAFTGSK